MDDLPPTRARIQASRPITARRSWDLLATAELSIMALSTGRCGESRWVEQKGAQMAASTADTDGKRSGCSISRRLGVLSGLQMAVLHRFLIYYLQGAAACPEREDR